MGRWVEYQFTFASRKICDDYEEKRTYRTEARLIRQGSHSIRRRLRPVSRTSRLSRSGNPAFHIGLHLNTDC